MWCLFDLATRVAHHRVTADPSLVEQSALSLDEIVTLLKFCLDDTYLAYRGEVYQQVYGTAMGSPVSVTVVNLVMEDVEQRALPTYASPPPFWKGYVDDTITGYPQNKSNNSMIT